VEEGLKHIEVSSTDLSAVDHVEHLEEHESVVDVGEMGSFEPSFVIIITWVGRSVVVSKASD
jgi:hypothetical protein